MSVAEPPQASDRFTPKEQAVAVWLSHFMVLVVVLVIMLSMVDEPPPVLFIVAEGLILLIVASVVGSFVEEVGSFIARYWKQGGDFLKCSASRWREDIGPPVVFAVAFLLQYVAVTPLVIETGGATASPFAQLAVAFAVFAPLLANKRRTVWLSLLLFLGYYATMVFFVDASSGDIPREGVFFAVTALIVAVAVTLTLVDRADGDRRLRQLLGPDGAA